MNSGIKDWRISADGRSIVVPGRTVRRTLFLLEPMDTTEKWDEAGLSADL
jgi:hypothetical protein